MTKNCVPMRLGHHVQHMLGSTPLMPGGETKNQESVRVELQGDCLAGAWGHTACGSLKRDDADLKEVVTAAHAIGDDALGHLDASDYTHGTSVQRIRRFRRGFDGGDRASRALLQFSQHAEL
jgi:predicted metalloprotease